MAEPAARQSAAPGSGGRKGARPVPPQAPRAPRRVPVGPAGGLTVTTRAALLGLALCAVVLTLAYPAREYLSQRRQVNQLAAAVAADKSELQALRVAGRRDADPAYVEQQARLRLHWKRPGDQVFIVAPAPPKPAGKQTAGSVHTPVLPGRASQPWYSQLYRSTVESGR